MDSMMMDMMKSMPADEMMGMGMPMMQECIETCSAAAMAATMCSDSDTGADMATCSSMCANTADVATTMMRMMMRPAGYDEMSMRAMIGDRVVGDRLAHDGGRVGGDALRRTLQRREFDSQ